MERLWADCRRWVSLQKQESCRWQACAYLPDVTVRLLFLWTAKGVFCQLLLGYFFYKSWQAAALLFPIAAVVVWKQWSSWKQKMLMEIESGFKEWLFYVKSGLAAGRSAEYAILEIKDSFAKDIGAGNPLLLGLEQVYRSLELHIPAEVCMRQFAQETQIEVLDDFAVMFEIGRRQGGSMSVILERTIQQITARIALRQEIYTMIAAKKIEQRIMCAAPFGILFFIGRASGGYFEPLYHNVQGILIMTGSMLVYLFSVWWGEKMTEIWI